MNVNVIDFGAVGDGVTDNTDAFAAAVEACSGSGGGLVSVPAGQYVSGTVRLQSHVYLELQPGCELLGSMDFSKYSGTKRGCAWMSRTAQLVNDKLQVAASTVNPCKALVVAEDAHHVGIVGFGTLDGRRDNSMAGDPKVGMPFLVVFSNCTDVTLETVTMTRPGSFTNYLLNCKRVNIRGLHIHSTGTACGDGIDFDGGQDVTVSDCFIDAGDDGIGLKTLTPAEPCERFTITNCHIRSQYWGCIRIGPETASDYRFITVSNCVFYDSNDGIKLQLCEDRVFEDFTFSNLVMDRVTRPFLITNTHYPFSIYSHTSRPACGSMRRILFSNISAVLTERRAIPPFGQDTPYSGCLVYSLPDGVIEEVAFSHIRLLCLGGGSRQAAEKTDQPALLDYVGFYPESCLQFGEPPAAAFTLRNAKHISFSDVTVTCTRPDERCAFAAEHVEQLELHRVRAENTAGLLRQHDCKGLVLDNSEGRVVSFTPGQTAAHEQAIRHAAQMEEKIRRITALADSVSGTPVAFDGEKGLTLPAGAQGTLVLPLIDGCFAVTRDDRVVEDYWVLPEYRCKTLFACPIPAALRETVVKVLPGEDCTCSPIPAVFYRED